MMATRGIMRRWRGPAPCSSITTAAQALTRCAASSCALSPGLHVGVVGLGAIGTIFFGKLAQLAAAKTVPNSTPHLTVDAFIKPGQISKWMNADVDSWRLQMAIHDQDPAVLTSGSVVEETPSTSLRFATTRILDEDVAVALETPNVRVRTLMDDNEAHGKQHTATERLDVLLLAVKAYDSAALIRQLRERHAHLLQDDAVVVLLQNGLGELPSDLVHDLQQESTFGWQFVNGVTFVGGRVLSFGHVLASGLNAGTTYLAPISGVPTVTDSYEDEMQSGRSRQPKIKLLAEVLQAVGLRCELLAAEKMQAMLWRKLIVNAAINPLASLLDAPNKSVANTESSRQCVRLVVQEALAVARSEQIPLTCTEEELVDDILAVACNTGGNVCSMLADLRRGSRTEIEAIAGRIVAGGKRHGVPTPCNEMLLSLIKALEEEGTRRKTP